ncbi:hypothetical protein N9B99_04630 [Candidatus Pelagibacter sp.]|jgi:surface carbohydrate biosynthesis protein|nr:hypothetical protein [Candidatus Pelagibacter sp.]
MNIYIEIEVLKRELNSKLLLSLELIKRNHTVYLISRDNLNHLVNNNKIVPGIIFLKDMNAQSYRIQDYKNFVNKKFILVSQDEEIGCFKSENFSEFFNGRFKGEKSETFKLINKYFCWGDFDYNFLNKYQFYTKFVNTGSARMDLCNSINKNTNKEKRKILISLNQNIFFKRDFIERLSIEINDNMDDLILDKLISKIFQNESKDLILTFYLTNLIKKLNNLDKYEIIIRPHPAMDFHNVLSLFKNKKLFNNIKVSNRGALIDQISDIDILLHFGCTSGIESTLNNKTTICYYPNDKFLDDYKKNLFLNNVGLNFSEEKKLFEFFNNYDERKLEIEEKIANDRKKISERVIIDGNSYIRISDEIEKLSNKEINNISNPDRIFRKINIKSIIKKIINKYIFKPNLNQSAFDIKFPEFNEIEIKNTSDYLNRNFSINTNYKLNKLSDRCIKISK